METGPSIHALAKPAGFENSLSYASDRLRRLRTSPGGFPTWERGAKASRLGDAAMRTASGEARAGLEDHGSQLVKSISHQDFLPESTFTYSVVNSPTRIAATFVSSLGWSVHV